jgi:hypothetical protein
MAETLAAPALDLQGGRRQFDEHGYCIIPGVLSAEELPWRRAPDCIAVLTVSSGADRQSPTRL